MFKSFLTGPGADRQPTVTTTDVQTSKHNLTEEAPNIIWTDSQDDRNLF